MKKELELGNKSILESNRLISEEEHLMQEEESIQLQSDINVNYDEFSISQFDREDRIRKYRSQSFHT